MQSGGTAANWTPRKPLPQAPCLKRNCMLPKGSTREVHLARPLAGRAKVMNGWSLPLLAGTAQHPRQTSTCRTEGTGSGTRPPRRAGLGWAGSTTEERARTSCTRCGCGWVVCRGPSPTSPPPTGGPWESSLQPPHPNTPRTSIPSNPAISSTSSLPLRHICPRDRLSKSSTSDRPAPCPLLDEPPRRPECTAAGHTTQQ